MKNEKPTANSSIPISNKCIAKIAKCRSRNKKLEKIYSKTCSKTNYSKRITTIVNEMDFSMPYSNFDKNTERV